MRKISTNSHYNHKKSLKSQIVQGPEKRSDHLWFILEVALEQSGVDNDLRLFTILHLLLVLIQVESLGYQVLLQRFQTWNMQDELTASTHNPSWVKISFYVESGKSKPRTKKSGLLNLTLTGNFVLASHTQNGIYFDDTMFTNGAI